MRIPDHQAFLLELKELEAYLDCGLLCRGFARLKCEGCGESVLVAFSCKGRGFCPSCMGRRMSATAANLMERVLAVPAAVPCLKGRPCGDSLTSTHYSRRPSTRPRRLVRPPLALATLALGLTALGPAPTLRPVLAQDAAPRTTLDAVYTPEQATRGGETYARSCAACHPLDWYKGEAMKSWEGATLLGLYDSIATTMPQDNPGSLKRSGYVSLLAYILSLNELPTGSEEIPEAAEALSKIVIQWRKKP